MASRIFFLVSALCIVSASANDWIIDCGSSEIISTDDYSITWMGDDALIQNGESKVVPTANSVSTVMDTLRVFSNNRKKNCYTVQVDKGGRVLVRASFYYGNYDDKSSPPTFDLQFDGNHWVTVETSITRVVSYEVTYVVKGDYVSVCVAQTNPGQFPFISALEVRSLDSTMYSHLDQAYPLHLIRRVAYGSNETIRYIDDPYDRIWSPAIGGNGLINVQSDAILTNTGSLDQPPPAVLQNAVTAESPTAQIQLLTGIFPPVEIPVYLNMYFSEVTQLDSTQNRSFQVLMDNEPLLDHPIIPLYGGFTELNSKNLTVSSNTTFLLVPTDESNLPPLINALEVFLIGDVMTDGTNSKDVEGLASLQNAFDVLQGWSGDPCLPRSYTWDWIDCSSDPTPRVTALYLSSFDLSGELPDFSSMDALEKIDFHNNSLNGPIPDFLTTFPNLKQLNLASNQFSGSVPDSLSKKNGLNLVVTGNPDLCTSGKSCGTDTTSPTNNVDGRSSGSGSGSGLGRRKKKSKLPVILGTTIPISVAVAVFGAVMRYLKKRKSAAVAASSSGPHGANRPQASPMNPQMMGKIGEAFMNEIKIDVENQVNVELSDQMNQQDNNVNNTPTS